jgi:hypothetical protein
MAMTLSKTNRFWKSLLEDDATWRVLCEELYKVRWNTVLWNGFFRHSHPQHWNLVAFLYCFFRIL